MKTLISALVLSLVVSGMANEYIRAPEAGTIQPPTEEWISKIESLAPASATMVPSRPRKILVFSLATGFKHTVKPHVQEVFKVLGQKAGAFEVVLNDDISAFESEYLAQFDAVVLNNVCPDREKRDVFWDVLKDEGKAAELEGNLIDYVAGGRGLVVIHGAIAFQNNSMAVSKMIGGSFDWHPEFQVVTLDLVDPAHPLVAVFEGKGYLHYDEPYLFKNAYKERDFRPLLEMDVSRLNEDTLKKRAVAEGVKYVAWIKSHGEGRVFYCSPSHNPASYETEAMLRFLLDGTQYALGDLECDDTPVEK